MKQEGLQPLQKKRFVPKTTQSAPGGTPCANLLLDYGVVSSMNEVWVGDITYIPLIDTWAYLAMLMDLYSRRIIAWKLADHMRTQLVIDVLLVALTTRGSHQGSSLIAIREANTPHKNTVRWWLLVDYGRA